MNQLKWIVVSTAFLLSMCPIVAYAQNESEQEDESATINLETLDCRSLLKQSDSDQEGTLTYYHGFMNGKNNELIVDVLQLADISEKVFDHCVDNPNDSLLRIFEQYQNTTKKTP